MKCPICLNEDDIERWVRLFNPPEAELWECPECQVVFQWPQNDFDYSDYQVGHREKSPDKMKKRRVQHHLDVERLISLWNGTKGPISIPSIFDVGCSQGEFLSNLLGVPYYYKNDPEFLNGIDIRDNPFCVGDFTKTDIPWRYDIVHMRATIEHLKDPISYIAKAHEVIKDNGMLAVTHIPNIGNYPHMQSLIIPDEHIFYFHVETMQYLFQKNGFKIVAIDFPYYGGPYEEDENAAFMNVMSVYGRKI